MSKIMLKSNKISLTTSYSEIPLKDAKIILHLCDQVGEFTFIQNYVNNEVNPIEVFYTFPTPSYSSIFYFKAKIDNKTIKGILKEKNEAIKEYNENIKYGNGVYLMERIEGDIFSICIGNFPPKSELTIKIKYIVELKTEIDATQLRIHIPLTIMPKYLMTHNLSEESLLQNKLVNPNKTNKKPYNFAISGYIFMNDGINSLDSKTSKIKISKMKNNQSLDFEIFDIENLDEDIILTVNRNKPQTNANTQRAINLNLNNEIYRHCTMVNIIPDFKNLPDINPSDSHYVLILDRSGSMMGKDLLNCKESAKLFIKELPLNSSFDIYHFGSDFEKFKLNDYDKIFNTIEYKLKAIEWVDQINCNGGTEIYNVLVDAYICIKQTGKNGVIIMISDGGISDVDSVLKLVKINKNVNVFTIGIGQSVSINLIQGMANEGNGKAEFINSGNDQLKDKVLSQLKRSQNCIRKVQQNNKIDIQVEGDYKMVPEIIPTLFEHDLNTFFIFSQNEVKNITYTQILESYNLTTNIILNQINHKDYLLHRMAGIKLIENLQNEKEFKVEYLNQKSDMIFNKEEIIMISLNLNILSKYTSFIGIEYRENKINEPLIFKEIPLQLPKKYNLYGPTGPCGPQCLPGPSGSIGCVGLICQENSNNINDINNINGVKDLTIVIDHYKNNNNTSNSSTKNNNLKSTTTNYSFNNYQNIPDPPLKILKDSKNKYDMYSQENNRESNLYLSEFEEFCEKEVVSYNSNGVDNSKNLLNKFKNEIQEENYKDKLKISLKNKKNEPSKLKNNIKIKYTIFEQLLNYTNLGHIITSTKNEILPVGSFFFKIKINDYICIDNDKNNGIYKIISVGSINSKWILEKIKEKSN